MLKELYSGKVIPMAIARMLTEDKVERPSYYQSTRGASCLISKNDKDRPYTWNTGTITYLLGKHEYMGHTVNFRFYKQSYKDKKSKLNPIENWKIFENTHPAIVDPETWETAQSCRKTRKRTDNLGEANPLTGKLFCADCGSRMYNHRTAHSTPHQQNTKTGTVYMRAPMDVYRCAKNNNARNKFERACSLHNIRTVVVRELVLETIKAASQFVKSNEAEFVKQVREASEVRQEQTTKTYKKRMAKEQKRIAELDTIIRCLYEDNISGKLTDKRFEVLSLEYETEQENLEKSIAELQLALDNFHADSTRADKFIELTKRYTDYSELTGQMINEFVEKVIVHEGDRSSGERVQEVEIYLNFIGKFEIPQRELTPEEIAAEEKRREWEKGYREKKKHMRESVSVSNT